MKPHKKLMPETHLYLWLLAVRPDFQGRGLARRLVESWLESADASTMPCYLETYDEKNVPFYRHLGFELLEAAQVPDSGMTVFVMARKQ